MILDMQKTYTNYLNQTKNDDRHCIKIWQRALELQQDLYSRNKERKLAITLVQEQAKKLQQYKKIIHILPKVISVKTNSHPHYVQKSMHLYYLIFIYTFFLQAITPRCRKQVPIESTDIGVEKSFFRFKKFTKLLHNQPIFIDGKVNLSINNYLKCEENSKFTQIITLPTEVNLFIQRIT